MESDINYASVISAIISSYYQKLVNLIYSGNEDSDEFNEILDNIKHIIIIEKDAYKRINLKTINNYFSTVNFDGDNPIENRCFSKLTEREKILCGEPKLDDDSLLSNIIESKIMIDMLKLVHQKLQALKEDDIDEESYNNLMIYYHISRFTYLTDNSYIEKIALKYNFDIEKIPPISFKEISTAFNIDVNNDLMEILYMNIFTELSALYEICEKDQILNTYLALTELSRIEVMLSYLDEKTLDRLIIEYKNEYGNSNKETMINASNLIKKRKKEFK